MRVYIDYPEQAVDLGAFAEDKDGYHNRRVSIINNGLNRLQHLLYPQNEMINPQNQMDYPQIHLSYPQNEMFLLSNQGIQIKNDVFGL